MTILKKYLILYESIKTKINYKNCQRCKLFEANSNTRISNMGYCKIFGKPLKWGKDIKKHFIFQRCEKCKLVYPEKITIGGNNVKK